MCKVTSPQLLRDSLSPTGPLDATNEAQSSRKKTRHRSRKNGRNKQNLSYLSSPDIPVGKQGSKEHQIQRATVEKAKYDSGRRLLRRKGSFGEPFTSDTSCTSDSSSVVSGCAVPQYVKLHRRRTSSASSCVNKSRFVAMDCEMVGIGEDGLSSALARVSIVNWDGDVLLDTYVKVTVPVTDLRSNVSGISHCHIDGSSPNTMDFDAAAQRVQEIISDKILVGHGLKNDLRVLNMSHPWQDTRDTTKYEPFMKRDVNNLLIPRKLRDLSLDKIGVKIQADGKPHCSVSDAVAAMQLYQTVSKQWEKVIEYKVKKTQEILSLKLKEAEG
jgi:RNA exonuclease 4